MGGEWFRGPRVGVLEANPSATMSAPSSADHAGASTACGPRSGGSPWSVQSPPQSARSQSADVGASWCAGAAFDASTGDGMPQAQATPPQVTAAARHQGRNDAGGDGLRSMRIPITPCRDWRQARGRGPVGGRRMSADGHGFPASASSTVSMSPYENHFHLFFNNLRLTNRARRRILAASVPSSTRGRGP